MGNASSCYELGHWDANPDVITPYTAANAVYQDMTLPLPCYFISAGHNSYLTGNQLSSDSGTATIELCLVKGCRVIELDVYNDPKGGQEPCCKHGGTLTKPVAFRACIRAIAEKAFAKSPYPVILTMENHTDAENQGYLAGILRAELKDKLYVPDPADPMAAYKSPEELKHKVVCRTSLKKEVNPEFKQLIYVVNSKFQGYSAMIAMEKVASSSFDESKLPKPRELGISDEVLKQAASKRALLAAQPGAQLQMIDSAGAAAREEDTDNDMTPTAAEAGSLQELYTYNGRHLMRVYPGGLRIDSSNFNPMLAWLCGASLAAMNWQNWGKPLWINEAKFMDNGGCGYVLKPDWMRKPDAVLPERNPRTLQVTILSAHMHQRGNWCCFRDDLFVQVNVWGMPIDKSKKHTPTVHNSGRLVVNRTFTFDIHFPEMAVLAIRLMDEDASTSKIGKHQDADCLAYYTLPVSTLAEGRYKLRMRNPSACADMQHSDTWIKVELKWAHGDAGANPAYAGH